MRVLHIGNIANNAYWTARILNDAGLENIVLSRDYYHVMGCPEWEEVFLRQTPADQFYPEWHKVVGKDYSRPAWFVQGRETTCLKFLADEIPPDRLAKILAIESRTIPTNLWQFSINEVIIGFWIRLSRIYLKLLDSIYLHHSSIYKFLKGIKRAFWRNKFRRGIKRALPSPKRDSDCADVGASFETRVAELCERYRVEFPNSMPLVPDDFASYEVNFALWSRVFKKYDFVIGYALDGIRPLLAGVPYAAFEHGTIRDIPYEESARGRLCKLTYRMANHCFVTNLDCIESAKYLNPGRYSIINHPFDEAVVESTPKQRDLRERLLASLSASFLIFHPTRQDWKVGTGSADKANDNFWQAISRLRNDGVKVGVVCTEWGGNVSESVKLIDELGIRAHVKWIKPQATLSFLAMCVAVDLVADQFYLGAFGGITAKALACGTPVITYLDEEKAMQVFPSCPPVLNCRTAEEIALQVERVAGNKDFLKSLSSESKKWVAEFHSKDKIKAEFIKIISSCIS